MAFKYLVIVESPAKVKTIKKFLGANYEVMASNGHVRDMPKSQLGIDVKNSFDPYYITIRGKGEILSKLRKAAKKAQIVYLATDPDREGEAISWHLCAALKLEAERTKRITFNEITESAVKASIKNARDIDLSLVNAQQARRVLDRLVGYLISPVLWQKVKRGLSAGRVQSVALRIIADREDEISAFIPEEYWTLEADFGTKALTKPIKARLLENKQNGGKITNERAMQDILCALKGDSFIIKDINKTQRNKKPPLPFTTSTMQQEAGKTLNFATKKTMSVAQQLYEGVEVKGLGTIGLITYLRTDSTRVSEEAIESAAKFITEKFGKDFAAATPKQEAKEKKIQDAHEAIRPADISKTPESIKDSLTREQFRLYSLIWKRFVASRMTEYLYDSYSVRIMGKKSGYVFGVSASKELFKGFCAVYDFEENKEGADADGSMASYSIVDKLKVDMELSAIENFPEKHYTTPKPHYTESSLVRDLEELGIGRPSTYAPTISTILARRYVIKEQKNLYMTELGSIINNIMKDYFASIVNVDFTATLENLLDSVENGDIEWKDIVSNFYPDIEEAVNKASDGIERIKVKDEESDEICELCGKRMVIKYGRSGKFLACPGFPECRNTLPFLEKIGVDCPKCGSAIVLRRAKNGRVFYSCGGYPNCDFIQWNRPVSTKCPQCGGLMVEKGKNYACINESCLHTEAKQELA